MEYCMICEVDLSFRLRTCKCMVSAGLYVQKLECNSRTVGRSVFAWCVKECPLV